VVWYLVGGRRGAAVACAVLVSVAAAGCAQTVPGTPVAQVGSVEIAPPAVSRSDRQHDPAIPAELALPPERFPARYPAVSLPAHAVAQAGPDLTGVPAGARVDPPGCLPPEQDYGPAGTAMVVGTDEKSRATLTVEVVVGAAPLVELAAHLAECDAVQATHRGVTATVRTQREADPPAPVDGIGTLALARTVDSGSDDAQVTRRLQTRVAQSGDIRILVTYMVFDRAVSDPEGLGAVFRDAVTYALTE